MSIGSNTTDDRAGSRRIPPLSRYTVAGALLVAAIVGVAAVLLSVGASGGERGSRSRSIASGSVSKLAAGGFSGGVGKSGPVKSGSTQTGTALRRGAGTHDSGTPSPQTAKGGAGAGANGAGSVAVGPQRTGAVAEVRDPEEAKSFPVPASVHHRSASSPRVAAEVVVAAGAASDAEIRKELGEEERAKAEERAARHRALTPVAGGFSVGGNGTIPIPTNIPEPVQRVIAGGNAIADFPYIWGGGHGSFIANGYDCSGSVSYALAAGGLLKAPLVSGDLANYGEPGPGSWITIYANAGHTFMQVDGVWFDTAGRSGPYASRWLLATPPLGGYTVRHPPGF